MKAFSFSNFFFRSVSRLNSATKDNNSIVLQSPWTDYVFRVSDVNFRK